VESYAEKIAQASCDRYRPSVLDLVVTCGQCDHGLPRSGLVQCQLGAIGMRLTRLFRLAGVILFTAVLAWFGSIRSKPRGASVIVIGTTNELSGIQKIAFSITNAQTRPIRCWLFSDNLEARIQGHWITTNGAESFVSMEIPAGSARSFTRSVPAGADLCRFHYEYARIPTKYERWSDRFTDKLFRTLHLRRPIAFSPKSHNLMVEFHK
jgi:hypothetical protein